MFTNVLKNSIIYSHKSPERIDKFICSLFPDVSRRFFQNAIKNGEILVNEKTVSPSYKLKQGDQIKINIKKSPQVDLGVKPEKNIPFEIIFENSDFLVVNKPAGISVHPSEKEPSGTLVNGLLEKYPEIENIGEDKLRPGIVHRLDKETSGILIVAKTQKSFEHFKKLFQDRKVQKTYLAWVWGTPKNQTGKISDFTGKSRKNPTKQAVSANPDKLINPKEALTFYKVTKDSSEKSLLELQPKTGRKHQLRLHLHSIGHPILGDKKYFNKNIKEENKAFYRHLLHATKIEFSDWNNQKFSFESEKPKDFYF